MNNDPENGAQGGAGNEPGENLPVRKPRRAGRIIRRIALVVVLCVIALIVAAVWYAHTPRFKSQVRSALIARLEQATGGRVDLGAFHWKLSRLEVTADDLTIHGLEAPGQIPYAHVDRIDVRLKILSIFSHRIGLRSLEIDHPVLHLIVYPDGTTNQPHPKTRSASAGQVIGTIFNLRANRVQIENGVAILNERRIPFNIAANDVGVKIRYVPATRAGQPERYLGVVHVEDLTTRRGHDAPIHSTLDAQAELERNRLVLRSLRLKTGDTHIDLSGSVENFANPVWKLKAKGGVELSEVEALTGVSGLSRGRASVDVEAGGQHSNFLVTGQARVVAASYHVGSIHLRDLSASTKIHITRDEMDLTGARAELGRGGWIDGEMRIAHWLNHAPAARGAGLRRGSIHAQLHNLPLVSIMGIVAPPHYTDLGFDTEASGPVTAGWTGAAADFAAAAHVTLMPPLTSTAGRVPMVGAVDATYSNTTGLVTIQNLNVHTPASTIQVAGTLGVYPITRSSQLRIAMTTSDLGEFNRALTTLGVAARGRTGVDVIPVALHGAAQFTGTLTQSILAPDVQGHLTGTNFAVMIPAAAPGHAPYTLHWDSVAADAEYSPTHVIVTDSVFKRGPETVRVSGALDASAVSHDHPVFNGQSKISARVDVQDADVHNLVQAAGKDLPVTGTLNLTANASGTLDDLTGGGQLSVEGGSVYGQPYQSLHAGLRFAGREIAAENVVFLENGGRVTGSGSYDLSTRAFRVDANGSGFELARFHQLQRGRFSVSGALAFDAHAHGTPQSPEIQASLHVAKLNFGGVVTGQADGEVHTVGRTLLLDAKANLSNAQVAVHGQTELTGSYPTQAQLTLTGFNTEPVLKALNMPALAVPTAIAATVNLNGPLAEPRLLSGDATVAPFAISLSGVALKTEGPVRATLANGEICLAPLRITGEDTDMHAEGSLEAFAKPHTLEARAGGAINMQLVETLDSDLNASGHVDFDVRADGTVANPQLAGNVKFTNVSVALQDFSNGLSQMNGTLVFDRDRLDVKNLTAVSGGGKLTLGGFVTYQQGLYGDLTATAHNVRIRYPQGVSSMADARLRLQGTQRASLLSGNVTITRFAIGSGLSLAAFNSVTSGVTLPPNQNAPANHVRLDIHVRSAPQLDFQNAFAKLAGNIDLRVRGTLEQPAVLGHVSITEGSATLAGTRYELQHGDISFSNPVRIEPQIDLSATARVEGYDITVGLTGTPSKPVTTFRSEPPLSEQDIFSLLALGRTQEEQQMYAGSQSQNSANATADALLGGALNATLSSRIQKLFGGGSVKIDPNYVAGTGNATARITVQQQVSKYATLTYATNVNSTAEQLIQGQINITQNVSLVAVRDEAGVFSMLIKLRRRYR